MVLTIAEPATTLITTRTNVIPSTVTNSAHASSSQAEPTTVSSFRTANSKDGTGLTIVEVAGVAVGATIAFILTTALVVGLVWRHHRKRRREKNAIVDKRKLQDIQEKAQLHADDYKPHREELEGSNGVFQMRTIEGLHEIDTQNFSTLGSEMNANEVAAAELGKTTSIRTGIDTTSD